MSEAFVNVTEGSGKKLHTNQTTIGANDVHDEYTVPGEYPLETYSCSSGTVSGATSADHVLQLMAGGTKKVRIRRITLQQGALITTAAEFSLDIVRLSTAGTGGTAITPRPLDSADAASGAAAMSLPTVKGTEGVVIAPRLRFWAIQTTGTAGLSGQGPRVEWVPAPGMKSIVIPAGTANGIALKVTTGRAGITVDASIEFVETSF